MTPIELERLADAVAEKVAARLATVDPDSLVDVHRAAELIGCSVPTIERLTRLGVIPSMKIGRLRRYRPSDLLGKSKGGAA
jgi:excisionase family DNA binding protein